MDPTYKVNELELYSGEVDNAELDGSYCTDEFVVIESIFIKNVTIYYLPTRLFYEAICMKHEHINAVSDTLKVIIKTDICCLIGMQVRDRSTRH